jgi:rhodanese-related sulfurtransferase
MTPFLVCNRCLRILGRVGMALAGLALALFVTTSAVFAEPRKINAQEEYSAMQNKKVIILDIRSPDEWAETGLAKGAWPVSMHDASFVPNLQKIVARYPRVPIALICATGGRSNYIADVLLKSGLDGVIDIPEGMFGNGKAPGWTARNLPIQDVNAARQDHITAMTEQD